MAYIRTENGVCLPVSQEFVNACGLLRSMEETHGSSTESDPIPLANISDTMLKDLCACIEQGSTMLDNKLAPYIVEMWQAADFLDCSLLQQSCVQLLANKIQYNEPAQVMKMFNIAVPPTEMELQHCLEQFPFLREI